ncbi:MAG: hypothetical protein WCA35_07515 [Kovacikia sp.]
MNQPSPPSESETSDLAFRQEVERLYQFTVYARWSAVGLLWLTLGSLSLWGFRYPISLMIDDFTWAALRYGIAFHRLPAIGLATCIGLTVAVLIWQSRNILLGLPEQERKRLECQVSRIRQQGTSHPLWKFVCK